MSQTNDGDKRKTVATEEEKAPQISMDLYEEILILLSTKDLQICKSVCKVWLELISSPRFIQKHLCRSKAAIRVLIPLQSDIIDYYHLNSANADDDISNKIPYPLGISGKNACILGSCDGLICLVDTESRKLAMLNPSTRTVDGIKFKGLCFYWFGYHPSCGDYVLILGCFETRHVKVMVYKFSCNLNPVLHCSFRHQALVFCWEKTPVLLHGNLHWPAIRINRNDDYPLSTVILKYDLHKDKTVEIPVPGKRYFKIGVLDGCLFTILNDERNELWIMKEYGVEQSWTKYTNIEVYDYSGFLSPLGFCSNGDLILYANGSRLRLAKYSFRDRRFTLLKDYNDNYYSEPIVCVDSLVSPELIWGTK